MRCVIRWVVRLALVAAVVYVAVGIGARNPVSYAAGLFCGGTVAFMMMFPEVNRLRAAVRELMRQRPTPMGWVYAKETTDRYPAGDE